MGENPKEPSRGLAALFGFVIAVIVTVLYTVTLSIVEHEPLRLEKGVVALLLPIVLIVIPFLLLAFLGVFGRTPWLVGITLTVALWGYVVYDFSARLGEGSGASIGIGLLLLFSPVLISAACLFTARKELRR